MSTFEPLARYFQAEKQGALFLLAVGVVALAVSLVAWRTGWVYRAMAFPLGLIALAQLGIGVGLYARTDKQVETLKKELSEDAPTARPKEIARMEKVNLSFRWIEIAEIVLIAAGIALSMAYRTRPTIAAVGMGLLLQASLMLVFDLIAEARAHVYLDWLKGG